MSNAAAQEDLQSLSSIGLLAYIISLPEDFRLYKTYLQNKFTRRTVDGAFKELVEKKYIAGFSCYIDRKKEYFYLASDEKLSSIEFNLFVHECFYETIEKRNLIPKNLKPIKDNQFQISFDFTNARIEQHIKDQNVQYKTYSTKCTVQNDHIQINNTNTQEQINNTNINNNYKAAPPFYNWLEE